MKRVEHVLPLYCGMKVGARFHVELCDSGDSGAGMWAHEAPRAWLQGPCPVLSHLQPHLSLGRVVSHTHVDTQSVSLSAVLQRHSWVATWAQRSTWRYGFPSEGQTEEEVYAVPGSRFGEKDLWIQWKRNIVLEEGVIGLWHLSLAVAA